VVFLKHYKTGATSHLWQQQLEHYEQLRRN